MVRPRDLGAALADRGVKITYILDDVPYNRGSIKFHPSADLIFIPPDRSQYLRRRQAIRKLKPDFVHQLILSTKGVMALAGLGGVRVVGDWDEWPHPAPNWRTQALFSVRQRWQASRATLHLATTHYLMDWLREKFAIEALYLPYATYLPEFADGPSPFSAPTAVYMGNLFPLWDHDILFKAAEIAAGKGDRLNITIMGDGPQMGQWKQFVAERRLDSVTLAGFVKGELLWSHLRHAHVLLFPIRPTPINLARCSSKTFAYMQARRPVITSRLGEAQYFLGDHAQYVDPTPEAFAAAIASSLAAPRVQNIAYSVAEHSWGARADKLLEALKAQQA